MLRETRVISVSAPDEQGSYAVDWRSTFQAGDQDLLFQGGTAGGGYAGMSARIASDTRDWRLIDGEGREDVPGADALAKNLHGQHARWMDLSLVHIGSGQPAGLAILEHPCISAPPDTMARGTRGQDPVRLLQPVPTVE